MPELSANLSLPFLMPAQAQKHVTHNEALQVLDALVQLFDQRGRSLHDHVFGTRVVYAFAEPAREGAAP